MRKTKISSAPDFIIQMKEKLLFILILISFFLNLNACGSSDNYSQSYIIVMNGKKVGKEIVNEKIDRKGNLVCLSEQEMEISNSKGNHRRKITTKLVLPKGKGFPVSYSYKSHPGTSFNLEVKDGHIIRTLRKEGATQEIKNPLKSGMRMMDLNTYHTIEYWFPMYEMDSRDRHVIESYILPMGRIEKLPLIPVKTARHDYENELQIKSYKVEIPDRTDILLWIDKDNRLYRLMIQGLNIDVIRSDLFDELTSKKRE